jgi:hypothetical protein
LFTRTFGVDPTASAVTTNARFGSSWISFFTSRYGDRHPGIADAGVELHFVPSPLPGVVRAQ